MAHVAMVTLNTTDVARSVAFWTAALDTSVAQDMDGMYVVLAGTPAIGIQAVDEVPPGRSPVHLDLVAADREAEVARLVSLGAVEVETHTIPGVDFTWTIMNDPTGTVFCVALDHPESS